MWNHFYLPKLPYIEEISADLYPIFISTRNRENISRKTIGLEEKNLELKILGIRTEVFFSTENFSHSILSICVFPILIKIQCYVALSWSRRPKCHSLLKLLEVFLVSEYVTTEPQNLFSLNVVSL